MKIKTIFVLEWNGWNEMKMSISQMLKWKQLTKLYNEYSLDPWIYRKVEDYVRLSVVIYHDWWLHCLDCCICFDEHKPQRNREKTNHQMEWCCEFYLIEN